jgi:sarcosine oxidase
MWNHSAATWLRAIRSVLDVLQKFASQEDQEPEVVVMETIRASYLIIGAGAMGSAAAYHLARRGQSIVLFEQFRLGHDRGSSHGAARITRHSYADAPYARLMPRAFQAWRELEADAGRTLYIRCGGVSFSPPDVDYAARVAANLAELDVPHWHGTGRSWNERCPAFSLPDAYDVVFEPDAGILAAARAVALQVELARQHGGDRVCVIEEQPVARIDLDGATPVVIAGSSRFSCERLIVTAGAWVSRLLPQLALPRRVTRQQVLYLRPSDTAPFQIGRFPAFIFKGRHDQEDFYGMPPFEGLGVKVARHGGPEVDPDLDDRMVGSEYQSTVRKFLRHHILSLADAPLQRTEICLYTVAPDDRFLIDFLPGRSDVIVASPCSGHGFKFSCLIGSILADMAIYGASELAIDTWKI